MNLLTNSLVIGWAVLASIVLALLVLKTRLEQHEDLNIHIDTAEGSMVARQYRAARRLDTIEFWGKLLTVTVQLWGLAVAARYFYAVWRPGDSVMNQYH